MRRVVITGIGVFASTGKNADSFFETLAQGRSAIRRIQQFDPAQLSVQIGAEIPDYDPLNISRPNASTCSTASVNTP